MKNPDNAINRLFRCVNDMLAIELAKADYEI